MGNTVSASNPVEILPVESYINDKCEAVESLGSTRFMKVARARTESGYLSLFKVFVIQDDSLDLTSFRNDIIHIRNTLYKAPSCLPIRTVQQRKSHAILVRSYQKYTLFDRLSTRPFINDQERLWYIYQLFKALDQCQKADICHGDLKSQNVLLSSANWLQITDFASFKPTFLPHDNPSSFTFFFDTSRRQSCHLAPERFLSSVEYEANVKQKGETWVFGSLTPAMDMFSAGCVVYEILSEGRSPFSYGQLCEYIAMKPNEAAAHLDKLLADIPQAFCPLLRILLNREPAIRITAQQVLEGPILHFPHVLDWFYNYFETFRPKDNINIENNPYECEPDYLCSRVEPDAAISRLVSDEEKIFDNLKESEESRSFAILVIGLINSHIRSLRGAQAKVDAMRLLVKLSYLCDCTVSLERILPYLVYMLSDSHVTVRVFAIHSIVDLVQPLEPSNVEQSLVFIDYLLPEFTSLLEKRNPPSFVVQTLAANLGTIAQCAYRFLVTGQGLRAGQDDECSAAENLSDIQQRQNECDVLSKSITDLFVTMSSSENVIRHCLINTQSLAALFKFFSKMGNDEILIRHMITFLNAKVDWRLRTAFFDALPICVQKRTVDVRSLLQQGLHDYEELVVVRVLNCISVLVASDLLDRQAILVLLRDIVPFLAHPNDWIRVSVVNILVLLDSRWTLADIHCKLLPELKGYLSVEMLRLNSKVIVMKNLKDPIPRELWTKLMTNIDEDQTIMFLTHLEKAIRDRRPIQINEPWYTRRFGEIGDEELKWKIHKFGGHLVKMAEFRKSAGMESELTMQKGVIDLTSFTVTPQEHVYGRRKGSLAQVMEIRPKANNAEWQELFGTPEIPTETSKSTVHVSQIFSPICGKELQNLLHHKEALYFRGAGAHTEKIREFEPSEPSSISGILLTHLHEHTDKITRIATCPDHQRFASASLDGSIKLWNERSLIGECYGAVRSDGTFYADINTRSPVNSAAWLNQGLYLALAAANGDVIMTDLSSPDIRAVSRVSIPANEGPPQEIYADGNVVFLRTHHSVVYCLDKRVGRSGGPLGKHEAWRREVAKTHGLVASFCVDPWKSNWMVLGVTNKKLLLWDLRYQQEVGSWDTPKIPMRLWSNPCSSFKDPEVFTAFNEMGDVSVYGIGHNTAARKRVLWSALSTPLLYDDKQNPISEDTRSNITYALSVCRRSGAVFTGDAQGALRKWNMSKAHGCTYLSGPRKPEGREVQRIAYDELIMNTGTEEVHVIREKRVPSTNVNRPHGTNDVKAATRHRTSVTDVVCVGGLLASGSADGVIKIWK